MELLPVGKMLEGDAIRMADGCSACGGTADGLARHEACTLARLSAWAPSAFIFFSFTCYTYKYPKTKNNHTYVLKLY
jgi:hypothetical protein